MAAEHLFRAYLIGWLFIWGLSMGSLALVMIRHLTGGAWGIVLRRRLEAQMRLLPLVALLFVPIALGAGHLFPWAGSRGTEVDGRHRFTADYFRPDFVWARAVVYFAVWIVLGWLLSRWSQQEDDRSDGRPASKSNNLSGPGLVLYGITLHFAAIDWMMSIEWPFTSTIFAPIVVAGQLLSALACAIGWLPWNRQRFEGEQVLSGKVLLDIGNLLLTLVIVWTYLVWCQFMLIWIGDLPRDNRWLVARAAPQWHAMAVALALFQFAVPFFLLLMRVIKQNVAALGAIAALVVLMQLLFMLYQLVAAFGTQPPVAVAAEVAVPLLMCGVWLLCTGWIFRQRPALPLHDRNWPQIQHLWSVEQEELTREEAIAHG
jgi:hypothetical protein